jgi:zinc protease
MVFSGAISPEEIFLLAEQYFAPIPRQNPPPPVRTIEPEQQGERRIVVETEAPTPLLHLAFHSGAAGDPETRNMKLLLQVLVGDSSSRLHRLLVEDEQLALSVGGWQDEGFDPGLVYLYLALPPDSDVAAVEARVLEELARVASEGVTSAELGKAKNILLAGFWRELATINGKASALGNYEVFTGSFENLFTEPDEITAVTREQLQAVAATVFRRGNMTIGVLRDPVSAAGESS